MGTNLDPDLWQTALQAPEYESIPVQIVVQILNEELADLGIETVAYNIFDFRPGNYVREEENLVRLT